MASPMLKARVRTMEDEEVDQEMLKIEEQQRQVLRTRKMSDLAVYGNEGQDDDDHHHHRLGQSQGQSQGQQQRMLHDQMAKRNKLNGEEVVVVDDDQYEDQWGFKPHTLTCGFLLMAYLFYAAYPRTEEATAQDNAEMTSHQAEDLKRGIFFACFFFLVYCALQLPDGHFVRPHPVVWRLVTGTYILYEMWLIVILFLDTPDARQFMTHFDANLGHKLRDDSYAADCRVFTPENPESSFINLKNTILDRFVIMHFVGWFVGALMLRSYIVCWTLSIMFEFYEMTFAHWLPNFNECWWDHVFLDILLCNAAGIYLGMRVCRMFEMKKFNWVGLNKTNFRGKAKRAVKQFMPAYWLAYNWKMFRNAERFWRVLSMVFVISIMMLTSFFLKTVLWVPPSSYLNVVRLLIQYSAGSYAVAEYYIFCTFTIYRKNHGHSPVRKVGPRAWLGLAVVTTEVFVCIKHGRGMFTAPFPPLIKWAWIIAATVVVVTSSVYFYFFNKPFGPERYRTSSANLVDSSEHKKSK